MSTSPSQPTRAFCGKNQHEAAVLIAGPGVCICDECVDLCADIVAARRAERAGDRRD